MKKVGEVLWDFYSFNTCQHRGRTFSFSSDSGKLRITEVILKEEPRCVSATTDALCKTEENCYIACCSLGQHILVMAGKDGSEVFAALADVGEGPVDTSTIHITELLVEGNKKWPESPCLCPVSDSRALLYFDGHLDMWYCDIKEHTLITKHVQTKISAPKGFRTVPLRLANERLLVAGASPDSNDIILISCNGEPTFEKVGEVPGDARCWSSTVLIGERFVVGFGGWNGKHMDDIWIFDLQTKKASPVAKGGKWHPATSWPFLAAKDGILYIISGEDSIAIHSISLQCLSELIQDLDFQEVFQTTLGLELRRYPAEREETRELRGMRDLGGYFYGYRSHNTVDHQGRVFHFSQCEGKLCVTEIFFGPRVKTRTVNTGIGCKTDRDNNISCCPLGDKLLVMAGRWNELDMFCALVSIEPGDLSSESIHVEEKRVVGLVRWKVGAYLVQISENKVWMSFDYSNDIWIGELSGDELVMTMHSDRLPMRQGFQALPTRISGGRFLVAGGGRPCSTSVILITPGERFSFEVMGDMPGRGRDSVSTILIGERFVVGFGGWKGNYMDDMWIFDLKTHKISAVKKEGEWHPGSSVSALVVRDKELYVIGDRYRKSVYCMSFTALSPLILDDAVRRAFCFCLGLPIQPGKGFERASLRHYIPPSL